MIRANINEVKFEGSFVMISAEFCELAGAYKNLIKKEFPEITEEKAREMVIKRAEAGMMDMEELLEANKKKLEKVFLKLQNEFFGEIFGEEENE